MTSTPETKPPASRERPEDSASYILSRYRALSDSETSPQLERSQELVSHEQWVRTHVLHHASLLRLAAFAFLGLVVVPLYNLHIAIPPPPAGRWLPATVAMGLYPLAAWTVLVLAWERLGGRNLHFFFLVVDVVMVTVAIYLTGGPASWLFFLGVIRVADQGFTSFRRSFLFAILVPISYFLMLTWVERVDGLQVDWLLEGWKLLALYLASLYLSFTALAAQVRTRTLQSTIRVAQETIENLERESRKLVLAREEWRDLASRDPLTGLLNRKGILDIVDRGLQRAISGSIPFSLVAVDLDDFKQINDRLGHSVGDAVLRRVADTMLASGRAFDAVGRIGGDEFLIALPNCDADGACKLGQRIQQALGAADQDAPGVPPVKVSIGTATAEGGRSLTGSELLQAADGALYRAKERGGDAIEAAAQV